MQLTDIMYFYIRKEKKGVSSSCCHTTVTKLKSSRLLAHGQSNKTQREVFSAAVYSAGGGLFY